MRLEKIFANLQSRWQKSWCLRFFTKFTALGQLLDSTAKPNIFKLVDTYLSSSWWNRFWFRSFLRWDELCRFYDIINVAVLLKKENLLNEDNLNTLEVRESDQELISSRFFRGLVYLGCSGYLYRRKISRYDYDKDNHYYYHLIDHFSLGSLVRGLEYLKSDNILNQENFEAVTRKRGHTVGYAQLLRILYSAGILTPENRELVVSNDWLKVFTEALTILHSQGIATPEYRELIASHPWPDNVAKALSIYRGLVEKSFRESYYLEHYPNQLANALSILNSAGISTPENRELVAYPRYRIPTDMAEALLILHRAQILTSENRGLFATRNCERPTKLAEAILILHRAQILTPENRQLFVSARWLTEPTELAEAILILHRAQILIPENREPLVNYKCGRATGLAEALLILHRAQILTPENRELVASHDYLPMSLARVMVIFHSAGMLTPENLRELASTDSRKLLTEDAWDIVWHRIPRHSLTQANINRLFYATKFNFSFDNDRYSNIRDAANRIINNPLPRARVATVVNFNNRQSTHTASVHQTVSQSATKLLTSYGSHLDLETTIANIKGYVQGLDDSPKNAAAKRCIERITAIDYTFSDRTSGVSIRQLFALAWLAIHDSSKCSASLDDGLALLIDGLYEIQRGYNLDEHGEDNGGQDSPICSAGAFNKLIEKLNGVHQDVAVYYITHEGALSKFPKLVQSHAKAYLSRLAEPKDAILSAIENAGNIAPIWDAIKDAVIAELWDEFKAAYENNPLNGRFTSLIEYWADVEVDVTEFCTQIKAPELAQVSLFSAQVEDGGQVLSSAYLS